MRRGHMYTYVGVDVGVDTEVSESRACSLSLCISLSLTLSRSLMAAQQRKWTIAERPTKMRWTCLRMTRYRVRMLHWHYSHSMEWHAMDDLADTILVIYYVDQMSCDVMRCYVMLCDVMRLCCTMCCNAIRFDKVCCDTSCYSRINIA